MGIMDLMFDFHYLAEKNADSRIVLKPAASEGRLVKLTGV